MVARHLDLARRCGQAGGQKARQGAHNGPSVAQRAARKFRAVPVGVSAATIAPAPAPLIVDGWPTRPGTALGHGRHQEHGRGAREGRSRSEQGHGRGEAGITLTAYQRAKRRSSGERYALVTTTRRETCRLFFHTTAEIKISPDH